jgi:hypothetical protein
MKKSLLLCLLVVAFCANALASRSTSMRPIMNKAEEVVDMIEDDLDLEIVRIEYDILSSTKSTIRTLSSDWEYAIVAFGDYRFKDIDVKVYRKIDGYWTLIEQDTDANSMAVVTVKPTYTAEYKIEIKAYSFESGYDVGHYGLIIAHE